MNSNLEVFNQIRSDLTLLVDKNKGLKINGINDVDGYIKVKDALKETRAKEIEIEKLAKQEREGALNYQRGVISLEKDLKTISSPLIEDYKKQLEDIDEAKAIEERKILLPDRIKQLEQIETIVKDDIILRFNEKQWAEFYSNSKLEYLDKKDKERQEKEKKEADEKEKERIRLEGIEEGKRLANQEKVEVKEQVDIKDEIIKNNEVYNESNNDVYNNFLKECGINNDNKDEFFVKKENCGMFEDMQTITVYKKINSITI